MFEAVSIRTLVNIPLKGSIQGLHGSVLKGHHVLSVDLGSYCLCRLEARKLEGSFCPLRPFDLRVRVRFQHDALSVSQPVHEPSSKFRIVEPCNIGF